MADRVLFATTNWTCAAGSSAPIVALVRGLESGFDSFPFRIKKKSEFDQTDYRKRAINLPLTFQRAVEVYWRVRKWRVTMSGHAPQTNPSPPPSTITVDFSFVREFEIGTEYAYDPGTFDDDGNVVDPPFETITHRVTRERDLTGEYITIFGPNWADDDNGIIDLDWPTDILSFIMLNDDSDSTIYPDATFYPGFAVGMPNYGLPFPFNTTKPFTHPYALGNPGVTYNPYGDVTLKLGDGTEIVAVDSVYDNNNLTTGRHCDILIEAIEYWPYATSTGDPVYDTTTGAVINDPFS